MITYDDPIGRVLEFVASTYSVTAHVRFVHRSELLAHVVAGFDEGHGEQWRQVYAAIFGACVDEPVVVAAYPRYK